jgi:uncharacterized membrane protein YozB (DUF420 family)
LGLFNPNAVFLSDVNLLLQFAILVILILSFYFQRGRIYPKHGVTMAIAVTLHTIAIFGIMLPSLFALTSSFGTSIVRSLAVLPHAILGSLVEILGLYLVLTWALHRREIKVCSENKRFMKPTFILWLLELAIGIYVYIVLYVPF